MKLRSQNKEYLINIPIINVDDNYYLRCIELSDYKDMYEYSSDEEVVKYLTYDAFTDIDIFLKNMTHTYFSRPNNNLPLPHVIVDKAIDKVIGLIDVWEINRKVGEIGFVLHKSYWNKGVMSKVFDKYLEYSFIYLDLSAIKVSHYDENRAVARMIRNFKFHYVSSTQYEDSYIIENILRRTVWKRTR